MLNDIIFLMSEASEENNPTEQITTNFLKQETTRRGFLKGAAKVFAAAAGATLTSQWPFRKTSESHAAPLEQDLFDEETNIFWENFDWEKLREDIKALPEGTNAYKEVALPIVDRLEYGVRNVLPSLNQFYNLYREKTGSDGKTPELVELTDRLYGKLAGANPHYLTEEEIPFLGDRKKYINVFAWFVTNYKFLRDYPDTQKEFSDPDKLKKWANGINNTIDKLDEKYLNVGMFSEEQEFKYNPSLDEPLSDEGKRQFEADQTVIEELIKEVPYLKRFMVSVVLHSPKRYGQKGQVGDMARIRGRFEQGYKEGVITLNLENIHEGTNREAIKEVFFHEVGHLLDPIINLNLLYFFTSQQLYEMTVRRQQALLDGRWGRAHPNIMQLFERYPTDENGTTPEQFRAHSKVYPGSIVVSNSYGWAKTENLLSLADMFDQPLSEAMALPQKEGRYDTVSEFLADQKELLEQWKKSSSRNVRIVAEFLSKNPNAFADTYWVRPYNLKFDPLDRSHIGYWKLIVHGLSNIIYLDSFFKEDKGVVSQYNQTEKSYLVARMLSLLNWADREYFAEAMTNTRSFGNMSADMESSPFRQYLDRVQSFLTKSRP